MPNTSNIPTTPESFRFRAYNALSGLQELEDNWNKLFASLPERHFFHSFDWHYCYLRHLEKAPQDVVYFAVFDSHDRLCSAASDRDMEEECQGG